MTAKTIDLDDLMHDTRGNGHDVPITREEYRISHGDIGLYVIDRIVPVRVEREALGDVSDEMDVRDLVPWEEGIGMHLILLKSRDKSGTVREHARVDEHGEIELPFGHRGLNMYAQVTFRELENGWIRKYNRERRRIIFTVPEGWYEMKPADRFAFWKEVLAGKFGLAAGELTEGTTLYAYLVKQPTRGGGTFTKIHRIYRDEDGKWQDQCPTERGEIALPLLRKITTAISDGFQAEQGGAGDSPFDSPRSSDDDEREVGF